MHLKLFFYDKYVFKYLCTITILLISSKTVTLRAEECFYDKLTNENDT